MPSYVPPKKNDANGYVFYVGLVSQSNTKILQANPTLAAGDIKVAIDDGAPENVSAYAVDADFTKRVKITLNQAQTNGDNLTIICSDATGSEWNDLVVNIQTSAQTLNGIATLIDALQDPTVAAIADAVWDERLTGATHNVATSAGRRLRAVGTDVRILRENTCQAGGTASNVILDTGASSIDEFYQDNSVIIITDGTGMGQVRHLENYVGSTKVAEIHPDWRVTPDETSTYTIIADTGVHVHELESEALVQVNAEMVDALGVDTLSELSQAAPSATPTIKTALMLLYMIARNKLTTTTTELGIHNNAGTKIVKKVLADDGVTYSEDEMESGA